jgi:Spy/CpxP family protein refolding chaperone
LINHWSITMKKLHVVLAGLVAGVSLSVAVVTQAQPFGGMGPGNGQGMGMRGGHGMMAAGDRAAYHDARLAAMKTQLQINTSQEAAWQSFAAAAKQQSATMQALRTQMQQSTLTAPERMAQRTAMMQQREAAMVPMTNAFNALYAVLTPEQKAIADQGFGMKGGRGMGFGPRAG